MHREAALLDVAGGVARHEVLDADVGEGAAHHHLVVAAPRAVLVEVGDGHVVLQQVFAGGRRRLDGAGRRDVVGGDLVAEQPEDARAGDVGDGGRALVDALEVGRVAHVGGRVVPRVGLAAGRVDRPPARVAVEHVGVAVEEQLARDVLGDELLDLHARTARCPSGRRAGRRCPCRSAPWRDPSAPCRRARRRRPAAARRGSWPARRG